MRSHRFSTVGALLLGVALLLTACTAPTAGPTTTAAVAAAPTTTTLQPSTTSAPTTNTTAASSPYARPDWLGTRLLPLRPDEFGEVLPTPPELVDRAFETPNVRPPPVGEEFEWTIQPVPDDVLMRSTWTPECPVTVEELAYVTVSHWGFDQKFHTGELLVNASVADDLVEVFRRLHEIRFPIEEMRVIRLEEIDAHPTGDWNDTTAFVCRPAVGSGSWSQHAYGTAVDVNPFHNPYQKGDLVLPELASVYLDRSDLRPGMIAAGDDVVQAFAAIGWGWGGNWNSLKDWMHFSLSGG
ncbi:MAG: M15 family metallopeptidase [Acidimicrobiia bacterium]